MLFEKSLERASETKLFSPRVAEKSHVLTYVTIASMDERQKRDCRERAEARDEIMIGKTARSIA
jgi:hypothetical protein